MLAKLDARIMDCEHEIEMTKERLGDNIQSLVGRLTKERYYIKTDAKHRPNPLGIVQSSGLQIDLLSQELDLKRKELKRLKSLNEQE